MTMVERAARSIARADHDDDVSEWLPHARAVIEAMREPTDAMCREGARAGGVRSTWC